MGASIAERVAAGVAWLDANVPGWLERIDLEQLDLESCVTCVLGQLFGDYHHAPYEALARPLTMGFNLWDSYEADSYTELTDGWRRVIEERRAQTAGAS